MLSRCFLDFSVGVGASVIGLGQISSFSLNKSCFRGKLCITRGGVSYKNKLKSLYIRTVKCPNRHKNLDNLYFLNKYSHKTQNFDFSFPLYLNILIKNAKVEQLTKMLLSCGEEKALSLKILNEIIRQHLTSE